MEVQHQAAVIQLIIIDVQAQVPGEIIPAFTYFQVIKA